MNPPKNNLPDSNAVVSALRGAANLCQRLDLPKEVTKFEDLIQRVEKERVIDEAFRDEISDSLNGITALRILGKLPDDHSEYSRLKTALSKALFPEIHAKAQASALKKENYKTKRKAIRESDTFWQLERESTLDAIVVPASPKPGTPSIVRLTHSNSYGPVEDVEFFVRIGNPGHPTAPQDLDSKQDWIKADLVEELITVDGAEILRSEAEEPFEEEAPWDGTYEAEVTFPHGRHTIEIKILSRETEVLQSRVLSDWEISVL